LNSSTTLTNVCDDIVVGTGRLQHREEAIQIQNTSLYTGCHHWVADKNRAGGSSCTAGSVGGTNMMRVKQASMRNIIVG
jgi:hypothetical protein